MSKSDKILSSILVVVTLATGGFLFLQKNPSGSLSFLPFPHHIIPSPKITTVFLAGDIMLSRNVDGEMLAANDFTLPFKNVTAQTSGASISFANLESPFGATGNHSIDGSLIFNADPKAVVGLTSAGFDILSTANNHTLDQGVDGLNFTYNLLKQNNILPIGTTTDCHQGVILTRNNLKFGFLAYTYGANGKSLNGEACDANNLKQASADIENLKPQVDVLLVSMHMGIEYTRHPTKDQINFAHNAIDSGADFVVGAHPHWVQDVENYKDKYIFYSLGNFVFDQMWSTETRQALTVKLTYTDKTLTNIDLSPVIIDDYCCPRFANPDETKSILANINLTSTVLLPHN